MELFKKLNSKGLSQLINPNLLVFMENIIIYYEFNQPDSKFYSNSFLAIFKNFTRKPANFKKT